MKTLLLTRKFQRKISNDVDLKTFVSNVQLYTQRQKYYTRHITLLAKLFGLKNISELMKFPTPKYDKIKVTAKQTYNEDGTKILKGEVLRIEEN